MNINNIRNSQNFTSTPKVADKNEPKPTLDNYISQAIENIYTRSERAVPENGKFKGIECQFSIPDTDEVGTIVFMCDEIEPKDKRCLFVRVLGNYENESRSTLLVNDTKANIRNYLKSDKAQEEIKNAILQLQKSIANNRF